MSSSPAARLASVGESGKRSGIRVVQRLEHVVGDPRADHRRSTDGAIGSPSREHRLVRLLDGVAVLERLHQDARHAREHPVDDEAGRVAHEHGALAEPRRRRPRRSRASTSSVAGVSHQLDERQHGDRVEEVHADEALGLREAGAHLRHRQRRRVRGEDASSADDALELAEDLLLDGELLEHRLDHEVAAGEALVVGRRP